MEGSGSERVLSSTQQTENEDNKRPCSNNINLTVLLQGAHEYILDVEVVRRGDDKVHHTRHFLGSIDSEGDLGLRFKSEFKAGELLMVDRYAEGFLPWFTLQE